MPQKALCRAPLPANPRGWAGAWAGALNAVSCLVPCRELERLAREMQEKKLQQELLRQKEEDEQKKKIKKPKQGPVKEEPPAKKPQAANKPVTPAPAPLIAHPQPSTCPSRKLDTHSILAPYPPCKAREMNPTTAQRRSHSCRPPPNCVCQSPSSFLWP